MIRLPKCPYAKRCGGCRYQGMPYPGQLKKKQEQMEALLGKFGPVMPIKGMEDPYYYRNKVHAVFSYERGQVLSGIYEENTHQVVPVESCQIENEQADAIIQTIRQLTRSFKITVYNERSGIGLLRHVLIRVGHTSRQILVVLVVTGPVFPSKNNFVKALRKVHPEITSIVLNINNKRTSMVLGDRDIVLYGPGYITDRLKGLEFRISPQSFYQVNPVQTEFLYQKAIDLAALTGKERVLDAYCGTGTIGLIASDKAQEVIGVELNPEAVRDAIRNAKANKITNARFYQGDAGEFLTGMQQKGEHIDVLLMDPPRSGSTEAFLKAACSMQPEKIVYISCGPETQARDLEYLTARGYKMESAWPFDMFPLTEHVETVVLLSRRKS